MRLDGVWLGCSAGSGEGAGEASCPDEDGVLPSVVDDPPSRKGESVVEEADPSLEATVLPSAGAEEPPSEDAGKPDSAALPPSSADAEATAEEDPADELAPPDAPPNIKKTPATISRMEASTSAAIPTRVRVGIDCWEPSSRTDGPSTVRAAARAESRGGSDSLWLNLFSTSLSVTSQPYLPKLRRLAPIIQAAAPARPRPPTLSRTNGRGVPPLTG